MSDSTTPEPVQYLLRKIQHLPAEEQRDLVAGWAEHATAEQRRRLVVAGLLEEAAGDDDPAPREEHVTRTRQLPGGPIEVRCSCGKWGGVAPSYPAAEKSAAQHRESAGRTDDVTTVASQPDSQD